MRGRFINGQNKVTEKKKSFEKRKKVTQKEVNETWLGICEKLINASENWTSAIFGNRYSSGDLI